MGSIDTLPPIISNYVRAGAGGNVTVAQVEPFDIVVIGATSTCNGIGFLQVGFGFGPGVYPLNLASFVDAVTGNDIPVMLAAVWVDLATPWLMSLLSNFLFDPVTCAPSCKSRLAPGLEEKPP